MQHYIPSLELIPQRLVWGPRAVCGTGLLIRGLITLEPRKLGYETATKRIVIIMDVA